ncbi:MAG: hypothetical protein AAF567_14055 [Actinomycetota bacterium]
MEATKKTSATRAALLVVAALSMLLSGLFVATAARSDASPNPACPDGFNLTADQKNCFQVAVATSTDGANTCAEGLLTPDGSKCYIAARVIPQEGVTECPKGYSPDDSLGGMCARFEVAPIGLPTCPGDARGAVGSCYILVAKGPAANANCTSVDNPATAAVEALTGTLVGSTCQVTGNAPVLANFSCPANGTTIFGTAADCFSVQTNATAVACPNNGTWQMSAANECKALEQLAAGSQAACNAVAIPTGVTGTVVYVELKGTGGHIKASYCQLTTNAVINCTGTTTPIITNGITTGCKVPVDLVAGGSVCPDTGYSKIGTACTLIVDVGTLPAQCPVGTTTADDGCRRYVANQAGAPYCKSADAALNGKNCVYTAPFTVEFAADAYKCDKGHRAVVGDQVLCFLGDAEPNVNNTTTCLQGVPSSDGLYCIVPRIDTAPAAVAAPVPSFTG